MTISRIFILFLLTTSFYTTKTMFLYNAGESVLHLISSPFEKKHSVFTYITNKIDTKNINHLIYAAERNDLRTLDLFIKDNIDLNQKDQNGWCALYAACYNGHGEFVKKLLDVGVDVNKCTTQGPNALVFTLLGRLHNISYSAIAIKMDDTMEVHYLAKDLEENDRFFSTIQLLVERGIRVDKPFGYSACRDFLAIFKNRIDVSTLELAVEVGFKDIAKLLLFIDEEKLEIKKFMQELIRGTNTRGLLNFIANNLPQHQILYCPYGYTTEIPKIMRCSSLDNYLSEEQKVLFSEILKKRKTRFYHPFQDDCYQEKMYLYCDIDIKYTNII